MRQRVTTSTTNVVMENYCGQMEVLSKDTGSTVKLLVLVCFEHPLKNYLKVTGNKIDRLVCACLDKVMSKIFNQV